MKYYNEIMADSKAELTQPTEPQSSPSPPQTEFQKRADMFLEEIVAQEVESKNNPKTWIQRFKGYAAEPDWGKITNLVDEILPNTDNDSLYIFTESVARYSGDHGLTDEKLIGLREKLLPAIKNRDPQLQLLYISSNCWAMNKGEFGVGDFLVHCYATPVTPKNVHMLTAALKEIPTTDEHKFQTNREDVLKIDMSLRELVHDERPYVHELLSAMVDFYNNGNRKRLADVLAKGRQYEKGQYPMQFDNLDKVVFDRDFYENIQLTGPSISVPRIEFLRRLAKNTEAIEETPPHTSDQKLNERMEALANMPPSQRKEALESALDHINNQLEQMVENKEIGIEPNTVIAISWLERRAFKILQGLTYEEQQLTYKQTWFESILKFNELANSTRDFDKDEFTQFMQIVKTSPSAQTAYKLISLRVLTGLKALADVYKSRGKGIFVGSLWSGNVAHELIGLTDPRPASTPYGRRHRQEALKPDTMRHQGD